MQISRKVSWRHSQPDLVSNSTSSANLDAAEIEAWARVRRIDSDAGDTMVGSIAGTSSRTNLGMQLMVRGEVNYPMDTFDAT